MDDITRRGFLKGALALAGMAVLPTVPALLMPSIEAEQEASELAAARGSILTLDNSGMKYPFFSVNGQTVPMLSMDVSIQSASLSVPSPDEWGTWPGDISLNPPGWSAELSTDEMLANLIKGIGEPSELVIGLPSDGLLVRGNANYAIGQINRARDYVVYHYQFSGRDHLEMTQLAVT